MLKSNFTTSTPLIEANNTKRPKSANKKSKKVWFWATECKYTVILNKVKSLEWKAVTQEKNEPKCNLYWIDVATIGERFKTIQPWQTINHFPGNICY
jgi:hypothetical protein